MPQQCGVHAVLEVQLQRRVQPLHHADRRSPGVLWIRELREPLILAPIEVEARVLGSLGRSPCAIADRHERDPGAGGEGLLRAADRHVDPPFIERERHRAEAAHHVDEHHRAGFPAYPCEFADRLDHAGRRLRVREEHALDPGIASERVRDPVRIEPRSPLLLQRVHGQSERIREPCPPLREEPRERDEHLVTGREAVLDRGFEAARSARGQEQDPRALGAVERPQPRRHVTHQPAEPGTPVIHERTSLREEDLRRDRSRSGREDDLGPVHGYHSSIGSGGAARPA